MYTLPVVRAFSPAGEINSFPGCWNGMQCLLCRDDSAVCLCRDNFATGR